MPLCDQRPGRHILGNITNFNAGADAVLAPRQLFGPAWPGAGAAS